ncbi:histidine--tRNA ligase [Mycoplasmopsis columbina]|uniref:histidine--tRNA ligase n=1 Tax=Mycoplasmopsis columbina TaxID=114881 RepID=UPI0004A7640D|nr:histidine--tRNA ligase [Mycoplasmopsis columbina]VEU76918.1 Histidyl-tRNA synthetase [Mycoplasmopsis columbina]
MFTKIKGTRDLFGKEEKLIETIRREFLDTVYSFNFEWIDTPIFESAQLFKRSAETSDIVKKEMYEFKDKGQRELVLRPEGTAGFVRALIENKWYASSKSGKFAYCGPMFRYEQPQKGRYRQFMQAGVEYISEINPYNDAEIILLAKKILNNLGVSFTLKINSLGDLESRNAYQKALKEYLLPYKDQLNEINQERLEKNVLRILDDKEDSQKDFIKNAPKIFNYLTENSKRYFSTLTTILQANNVKYQIDYSLVRGLDYYDQIVFEFVSNSKNSPAQSTIIGGGRYSNLIEELGGPKLSACGWGFGIDRCADMILNDIDDQNSLFKAFLENLDIYVASTNENDLMTLFSLSNELRNYGLVVEFNKEIVKNKKIFDKANKFGAKYVIFNDPINQSGIFTVKNLKSNEKINFAFNEDGYADLLEFLSEELEQLNNLEIEEEE